MQPAHCLLLLFVAFPLTSRHFGVGSVERDARYRSLAMLRWMAIIVRLGARDSDQIFPCWLAGTYLAVAMLSKGKKKKGGLSPVCDRRKGEKMEGVV